MEGLDATKARLIEAAGEEFASKGYESARIRTICERAGANVAAVNYHFGDKEQLYVETVLHAHRCGLDAPDADAATAAPPAQQLRCFIHHFLNHVLAVDNPDAWQHRLMLREMFHPTTASDALLRAAIRPKFERLLGILRRFCPEADDRKLTALAFSVIGQCMYYRMGRQIAERLIGREAVRALDLDYLTDHITSFCLAALGAAPPLDEAGQAVADQAAIVG